MRFAFGCIESSINLLDRYVDARLHTIAMAYDKTAHALPTIN